MQFEGKWDVQLSGSFEPCVNLVNARHVQLKSFTVANMDDVKNLAHMFNRAFHLESLELTDVSVMRNGLRCCLLHSLIPLIRVQLKRVTWLSFDVGSGVALPTELINQIKHVFPNVQSLYIDKKRLCYEENTVLAEILKGDWGKSIKQLHLSPGLMYKIPFNSARKTLLDNAVESVYIHCAVSWTDRREHQHYGISQCIKHWREGKECVLKRVSCYMCSFSVDTARMCHLGLILLTPASLPAFESREARALHTHHTRTYWGLVYLCHMWRTRHRQKAGVFLPNDLVRKLGSYLLIRLE
jgi:hypothetical protein